MAIKEKIELLGKGLYKNIPDQLTLSGIPTATELDIVSAEDFDNVMLKKILPQAVEEKIDFTQLLEIDYHWILRCLRILNYGPYYTTNNIFCGNCKTTSSGSYRVNLNTIECKPFPEGFVNDFIIDKDAFIDFPGSVKFRLPTIQQMLNSAKDEQFKNPEDGSQNLELARICYMIYSINGKTGLTPVEVNLMIKSQFSPADYILLKNEIRDKCNYGLRAGGSTVCPRCKSEKATFIALVDDRFFRPTVDDLRGWRDDKRKRGKEDLS